MPQIPGGRMRGKEPDIPYQPWALEYTMRQNPPTGPDAKFEQTTDPNMHTCEPLGVGRIFMWPAKTRFVQTPEAVYILHEVGPVYRIVWLNAKHPDDPDPQYLGTLDRLVRERRHARRRHGRPQRPFMA